jgi:hypothetical protein
VWASPKGRSFHAAYGDDEVQMSVVVAPAWTPRLRGNHATHR